MNVEIRDIGKIEYREFMGQKMIHVEKGLV